MGINIDIDIDSTQLNSTHGLILRRRGQAQRDKHTGKTHYWASDHKLARWLPVQYLQSLVG
jgi:hypothetical protein